MLNVKFLGAQGAAFFHTQTSRKWVKWSHGNHNPATLAIWRAIMQKPTRHYDAEVQTKTQKLNGNQRIFAKNILFHAQKML